MESQKKKANSILEIIQILLNYKKIIIYCALIVGVLTTLYVFLVLDPIFFSSSSIKVATKSGGLAGLVGAGLPDISDLGELAGGSSNSKDLALYESILLSRRAIEEAIIKFKLNDDWKYKYMQDAVKNFRENTLEVKKDKLASLITIGIYHKDPEVAKEICEFMIYQLNKINTELNVQNAKNNREFVESRYNIVKSDLQRVEDSLKTFQDKFGLAPEIIYKAASQSELQLEAEVRSEEIKLELLKKIISPDQSEVKSQEEKISLLKKELGEIQNSSDITAPNSSKLNLKGAPNVVLNFNRLYRDVEIQNKILTYIIPILEQAKIEEKKETPSVIVLDPPNVPEKKVKPKRVVTILISILFTIIFISVIIIVYVNFKKISFKDRSIV